MNCNEIGFGTYDCVYNIMLPYKTKFEWEDDNKLKPKYVSIDKCLMHEVILLWEIGIKTTGCCCGHGDSRQPFIGVKKEFIPKMKELGYKVRFNNCRPNDEDSFIPKTRFHYGEVKKGFNWWD
jgi:hypothetical protein